jgi:hypothetical protein
MTYIVAFGRPGINAIIADTRVSWRSDTGVLDGQDTALKIGILFPGCIHGASGSQLSARWFIRSFKESIYGVTDTILGHWQRFERFIASYPFPVQQFQLMLSHRGLGIPRFAVLDSAAELKLNQTPITIPADYCLLRFGSGWQSDTGRTVLDVELEREFLPKLKGLHQFMLSIMKFPEVLIHDRLPYYVCLWFNERSLTYEKSQLERHGVGGVFHFVWQNAIMEGTQMPTVYIFSGID